MEADEVSLTPVRDTNSFLFLSNRTEGSGTMFLAYTDGKDRVVVVRDGNNGFSVGFYTKIKPQETMIKVKLIF